MSKGQADLLHLLALTRIAGIGPVVAKRLVAYCGGAQEVFSAKPSRLAAVPGIGPVRDKALKDADALRWAEAELVSCARAGVTPIPFLDPRYPQRLLHCEDGPLVLFTKGDADMNARFMLSIVGTRKATAHGRAITERMVEELAPLGVTIVSGLAFGIDITAHRAALRAHLPTIACYAHGLDRIYPPEHTATAREMLGSGAWVTEYPFGTNPDKENFPTRNRIVAGMTDATLVVEAGIKGGALITAQLASDYNRDVFAIPGRVSDSASEGCNHLIKSLRAALATSAKDIITALSWDVGQRPGMPKQQRLLIGLSPDQERIASLLRTADLSMDAIAARAQMSMSRVSAVLLEMEFEGMVQCLPGKLYRLA